MASGAQSGKGTDPSLQRDGSTQQMLLLASSMGTCLSNDLEKLACRLYGCLQHYLLNCANNCISTLSTIVKSKESLLTFPTVSQLSCSPTPPLGGGLFSLCFPFSGRTDFIFYFPGVFFSIFLDPLTLLKIYSTAKLVEGRLVYECW